jgi:hypothetical protein
MGEGFEEMTPFPSPFPLRGERERGGAKGPEF